MTFARLAMGTGEDRPDLPRLNQAGSLTLASERLLRQGIPSARERSGCNSRRGQGQELTKPSRDVDHRRPLGTPGRLTVLAGVQHQTHPLTTRPRDQRHPADDFRPPSSLGPHSP